MPVGLAGRDHDIELFIFLDEPIYKTDRVLRLDIDVSRAEHNECLGSDTLVTHQIKD